MSPRDFAKESRLPRFSLDRRVTVLVLGLTLAVVGAVAAFGIPAELFPRGFTESFLWVSVPWQDAPAREVLDKVTIPLEDEFGTVKGLDKVTSVSLTGMSRVFMWFKQGTDMDIAYREVRDRIERARVRFPSDIDKTFINKDDVSTFPVYMVGIGIDPDVENPWDLIQNHVIAPLERVDGVASISAFGLEEKEILVELDREKTNAAGLNIYELAMDLGDDNFSMASGTVRSGARKLLLRSVATYDSIEALENRLVAPSVRLGDVASITYDEPDKNYRARVNSKPAVALHILKESEANTREVSLALDRAFERVKANPQIALLDAVNFFDQGDIIKESLTTLGNSGMAGGFIAALVLFFFMRRFRLTLIVALSIPLSMLIGVTAMYFWGETLNLLTLIGLMMCVGLLVDNSVVVSENIHRLHREGLARRDACIKGAGEVGLAITMSTLTTIVVFLPAALVEGPARFFLVRMAIPVAVSVGGSLIVALVFIPLCVYLTLPSAPQTGDPSWWGRAHERSNSILRRGYEASFGQLNDGYNALLAVCMRRRLDLSLAIVGVLAFTFWISFGEPLELVEFVNRQEEEQSVFEIQAMMPENATLEETEAWFLETEKVLESHKEEFGLDGWFLFHQRTNGQLLAWFDPDRTAKITAKEAQQIVMEELPKKPGMELVTGDDRGSENDDSEGTYQVFIRGEDIDQLEEWEDRLEDIFVRVDGVLGLKKSTSETPNQLALVIDREKAQHFGVNPQVVAGVVGYALRGTPLPDHRREGKEIPARVRFQEDDRESLTELQSFYVPTDSGEFLPLSALTLTKMLPTSQVIARRNKAVGRSITLDLEKGREDETRERLVAQQAAIDLPEGMSFGADPRRNEFEEDFAGIKFAMILSVVLIYLLMGFLFESFILPLSILVTIPLSFIGVLWGHIIFGKDIDFLGAVAVILLVGVVVNNGIVLIDYVNRMRTQGRARRDAVLAAAHLRFRPIMMTAITTIGGLIPLALAGATSIGISYTSFSVALIGGMLTATLLTLLVVPVAYTMLDDVRQAFSSTLKRATLRRRPAEETEASAEA